MGVRENREPMGQSTLLAVGSDKLNGDPNGRGKLLVVLDSGANIDVTQ